MLLVGLTGGIGAGQVDRRGAARGAGRGGARRRSGGARRRRARPAGVHGAGGGVRARDRGRRRPSRPGRPGRQGVRDPGGQGRRSTRSPTRRSTPSSAGGCSRRPPDAIVVLDVPLLVESKTAAERGYEVVIVVEAPEAVRLDRLVGRGLDRADAAARMKAQATDEERRAVATHLLDNGTDPAALAAQVDTLWADLQARHAAKSDAESRLTRPAPTLCRFTTSEGGRSTQDRARGRAGALAVASRASACGRGRCRTSRTAEPSTPPREGGDPVPRPPCRSVSDEWCSLPSVSTTTRCAPIHEVDTSDPTRVVAEVDLTRGLREVRSRRGDPRTRARAPWPAPRSPQPRSGEDRTDDGRLPPAARTEITRDPRQLDQRDLPAGQGGVERPRHTEWPHHGLRSNSVRATLVVGMPCMHVRRDGRAAPSTCGTSTPARRSWLLRAAR